MTKYIDEGYVDLDKEDIRVKHSGTVKGGVKAKGEARGRSGRITEKDAARRSDDLAVRKGRGRPSLTAKGKRSPQLGVRVSDQTLSKLNARAEAEGKKVSEVVREAIERYV